MILEIKNGVDMKLQYYLSLLVCMFAIDSFAGTKIPAWVFSQYHAEQNCPNYCKNNGGWTGAWSKQGAGWLGSAGYCECNN